MERFSKVTHFLKDTFLGPNDLIASNENMDAANGPDLTALMESVNGNLHESNNDGFEVIYKVKQNSIDDLIDFLFFENSG